VRYDVVGVVHLPVDGERREEDPESPPIVNTERKPSAYSIAVSKWRFPRQSVASQLKIFTPVGTAITIDETMKNAFRNAGIPTVNMWCAHTSSEKKPIATVENAIAL
jgi:hypothetical protein